MPTPAATHERFIWVAIAAVLILPVALDAQRPPAVGLRIEPAKLGIGVLQGDATQEFGLIEDVATDGDGRVYTLDSRMHRLQVYDKSGAFIARTGRSGRGPGEFYIPRSIAVDAAGDIHVLDNGNARISRFCLENTTLRLVSSTTFNSMALDFCVLGDRYVLYGTDPAGDIRIIDVDGVVLKNIAPPNRDSSVMRQRKAANGPLVCLPERNLILVGAEQNGGVRAFHTDGRAAWSTVIDGFVGLRTRDGPDGSVTYSVGEKQFYHMTKSMFSITPNIVAVQWLKMGTGKPGDVPVLQVLTHFLNAATGARVGIQVDLPVIRHAQGSAVLAVASDPFPRVTYHRAHVMTRDR